METTRTTWSSLPVVEPALAAEPGPAVEPVLAAGPLAAPQAERDARGLRPVAHWVLMPTGGGTARLEMVWEIPDPMPI